MVYQQTMELAFERDKNLKALGLTLGIMAALLLLFIFYKWTKIPPPPPPQEQYVQIDLGIPDPPPPPAPQGDSGPGTPGESGGAPASGRTDNTTNQTPESPQSSAPTDFGPRDPQQSTAAAQTNTRAENVNAPSTPTQNPKNVMGAPTQGNNYGNGKENDSYNNVDGRGQGTGPSTGNGPGSDGKGGGVQLKGTISGRGVRMPDLSDDFNENAKVAVDITVNADGTVVSAVVKPLGTTTTNNNLRNIAIKKAKQFKFAKSANEVETGTIIFTFKVSA